jgi:transglutaminase-like putative cysteine protease
VNHRFTITAALASAAASTALLPLVSGGKWFFGGLGAVIVVALVGTATRHRAVRALPAVVCLLCALVALALYLNLIYAARYSYGHLVPSPRSLSYLWHSAVSALRATKAQTPPVPGTVGINLVSDAGIGLVAALTDLIAVRLRRCALAGLPLLVLFSVPIATDVHANTTESMIVFLLGMAGYLALLSTDGRERLRLWGRLVTPWNASHPEEQVEELGTGPSSRALAASGRRIGLAAVALALFAPLLIPGLHAQKLFPGTGTGNGNGSGSGGGSGANLSVNPLVSMTTNLKQNPHTTLFTYTTTAPTTPQYLVEEVLSQLSDSQATTAPMRSGGTLSPTTTMPPVPGLTSSAGPLVTTTVTTGPALQLSSGFLPVPYAPRRIRVSRQSVSVIPSTLMVATPLTSLSNLTYSVVSQDVTPTAEQLAAITTSPTDVGNLEVPKALTSLRTLARTIVDGATTPYAEALALRNWLAVSGGFTYNVYTANLAKDKPGALRDFLTENKTGYCQQFSFAMTVLARLLGIPARVAVGYDPGTRIGLTDRFQVDGSDAHAWTELYFTGYGWTTWDATPSGSQVGQAGLAPPLYTIKGSTGTGAGQGSTGTDGTPSHAAGTTPINVHYDIKDHFPDAGSGGPPPLLPSSASAVGTATPIALMVLAALLVAAVVAPRIARTVIRRRRWLTARDDAGVAHAAWAELLDNLTDYGIGHGPGETPRTLVRRVGAQQQLTGAPREALNRLAQAEERASYAREAAPAGALAEDVATVRAAVSTAARAGIRWRARLIPRSAVEELRGVLAHGLDVFSWIEVVTSRLARRLPRVKAEHS